METLKLTEVQKAYANTLNKDDKARFIGRLADQKAQAEKLKVEKQKAKVKAPGVIDTIEAIVNSCNSPKTAKNEAEIADLLKIAFPERELKGMLKTVHTQLTSGLKSKGFSRMEDERGIFINIEIRDAKRYFWTNK